MPPKTKKPRTKKPMAKPRARRAKKTFNVTEYAGCSVNRSFLAMNFNTIYNVDQVNLADFNRAVGIAQYYQHYRIKGITVTWKPTFDTYASTQNNGAWKPTLYYIIDKSGSVPDNVTLEALKQMGARPVPFDEKPVKRSWAPSVLTYDQSLGAGSLASQYKVSPWLNTNRNATNVGAWTPSDVNHLGMKFYIEQGNSQGFQFSADIEIQFEFKKPLISLLIADDTLVGGMVKYAKVDGSPDGVEGGTDGITIPLT